MTEHNTEQTTADSTEQVTTENQPNITAFSFGEPEPVLDSRYVDWLGIFANHNEQYYLPPVSLSGLAQILSANGTHQSALMFKRNQIAALFEANSLISKATFRAFMTDYVVFENAFLLAIRNRLGGVNRYARLPALNMRVGTDNNYFLLQPDGSETEYPAANVVHLKSIDVRQSVYGVPEYFAGIQSVLLGEAATLFRRKFYQNGAHAGYILLTFDLEGEEADKLSNAVQNTKGPGNFRSLYLNLPSVVGGSRNATTKDRVQVIPIGEIANKDEYENIKTITMQDILNMHRVPAPLASVMPLNAGGFGDLQNIREVYYDNEQTPLMAHIESLNDFLPRGGQIQFAEPRWLLSTKSK
jgi:PBSX family phage portal protein